MRKTITILLAATALAGLAVQPAAADDPDAWVQTSSSWDWVAQECFTPYRNGVVGQYGAWGAYHDGCTAARRCPYYSGCTVEWAKGSLSVTYDGYYSGYKQACNVRIRVFDRYGAFRWHADGTGSSTEGSFICRAAVKYPYSATTATVAYGDIVTVQANGVRSAYPGTARVTAVVKLFKR